MAWTGGGKLCVLGSIALLGLPLAAPAAHASRTAASHSNHAAAHTPGHIADHTAGLGAAHAHFAASEAPRHEHLAAAGHRAAAGRHGTSEARLYGGRGHGSAKHLAYGRGHGRGIHFARATGEGGISCVPFAREETGIGLKGNAETWWNEADGVYARGSSPEPGAVLSFRSNYAMRLGHVAVVTHVISNRQIEIDHANWAGPGAGAGQVSRNISVIDVSQNNDWTAVRVALGHSTEYGSVYPTYGFIYDRPDRGTAVASVRQTDINPPPRDLRPADERTPLAVVHPVPIPAVGPAQGYDEVAEAPDGRDGRTASGPLNLDAPDRGLR